MTALNRSTSDAVNQGIITYIAIKIKSQLKFINLKLQR